MTRIIAGFAGSITLTTPGAGTRPTSDRVREAIFSALDARNVLEGARVLDLYAGSGALGLEAASRGASRIALVDRAKGAALACRRNVAAVLKQAPAGVAIDVVAQTVHAYLAGDSGEWDIAFLDPPYELDEDELELELKLLAPRLAPDAVVLVERSSRSPEPVWPDGIELDRRKDYGDTTLWWARWSDG
jgi:16S rRNA (guanine966-N2)-methyltransferase